jgi:hypothetical protein
MTRNEVEQLSVDQMLLGLTPVQCINSSTEVELKYSEGEDQSEIVQFFKPRDVFDEFKRIHDRYWHPISLSLQHLAMVMTLELRDIYQELQLAVANFFRRQRECHSGHVYNVLVYQMTGYNLWRERVSVLEKAIYALAFVAGLIDAEREQFSPHHSLSEWVTWCRYHWANGISYWKSLCSLSLTREYAVRFKDSLLVKFQVDHHKVPSLQNIYKTVLEHCKCIGFDLMQYTQALFDSDTALNDLQVRRIPLKRELQEDQKFSSCITRLIDIAGSIMDIGTTNLFWYTLTSFEDKLQDMHTLHTLRELRWQGKFFRCLSVCTKTSNFMSLHPFSHDSMMDFTCDGMAGLVQMNYLLMMAQYVLKNGPLDMDVDENICEIITEEQRKTISALQVKVETYLASVLQYISESRVEYAWDQLIRDGDCPSDSVPFWKVLRHLHHKFSFTLSGIAYAMYEYAHQAWLCCRVEHLLVHSSNYADDIDWSKEEQTLQNRQRELTRLELILDMNKRQRQAVIELAAENLGMNCSYEGGLPVDVVYTSSMIDYMHLQTQLSARDLLLWKIRLQDGLTWKLYELGRRSEEEGPFQSTVKEFSQNGIDLWMEVIQRLERQPYVGGEDMHTFVIEITAIQFMAQLYFDTVAELKRWSDRKSVTEKQRVVDQIIGACRTWLAEGVKALDSWRDSVRVNHACGCDHQTTTRKV